MFPRSGVVAMNRAQSNEPDQLVSSTVSITVLSVTPARAKKLFAFASVEIDGVQIGVHGINHTSSPVWRDFRRVAR
jgi:hypothetical protein